MRSYHYLTLIIVAALSNPAVEADAQDVGQTIIQNQQSLQQTALATHVNGLVLKGVAGSETAASRDFTYNPAPRFRDEAVAKVAAKFKLSPAKAAELKGPNLDKMFNGVMMPYHLKANDAADIITAYHLTSWLIVNDAGDPDPASVAALRRNVGSSLSKIREIYANAGNRAALGEEMKVSWILLQSGASDAQRNHKMDAYKNSIAKQYQQQYHQDLRKMKLDGKGLHL